MSQQVTTDIAIIGGGIAGLWLLNRVRQAGLSAILFESGALGGGQTNKSQGIIHGGMKYALQGSMNSEALAMRDMPALWRNCLAGAGEIDLSAVPVLSQQQYLWSPQRLTAKITGFLAGAALSSKVSATEKVNLPAFFQHPQFKGEVFALDEMVLDVPILVRELVKHNSDVVFKIEPFSEQELNVDDAGNLNSMTVYYAGKSIDVKAQRFIFTAGAGNEGVLQKLAGKSLSMQRRPLHMVMAKAPVKTPVYAHCMGFGSKPRLTISTHYLQDGTPIWYLGGAIAEDGVNKSPEQQIKATRKELQSIFPWLNFENTAFRSFMIDRAEPKQSSGLKPDTCFFAEYNHAIIAWPTKLALAPKLAHEIMASLQSLQTKPADLRALRTWPMPPLATPVWEEAFCKSVS